MKKYIFVGILVVAILQLADYIFNKYFPAITLVNSHASWGIPVSNQWMLWLTIAALILITIWAMARVSASWLHPIIAIIGAGISNLIDRMVYGGVVDYIDIKIIPVFNLSDLLITAAIGWLIILSFGQIFKPHK